MKRLLTTTDVKKKDKCFINCKGSSQLSFLSGTYSALKNEKQKLVLSCSNHKKRPFVMNSDKMSEYEKLRKSIMTNQSGRVINGRKLN